MSEENMFLMNSASIAAKTCLLAGWAAASMYVMGAKGAPPG
jgi:hypothetical protein